MKKYLIILLLPLWFLASCSGSDEPAKDEITADKTLFVYMPWSSNLTGYFYQNLEDLESCIEQMGGLNKDRVIVFISTTSKEASLFEIIYKNGECLRQEIKSYSDPTFTTESGLTRILDDVISYAPAERYSMIIGCHGMGWLPVNASRGLRSGEKLHWEYTEVPLTRYFGGTSPEFQTDITTLSSAIRNTGVKMEYILFDDCYMSSIEVAYELKEVTDFLVASTCEVMAYGMPYSTMGRHLLGNPDYKEICNDFHEFYSGYSVPCGTLSVTDLSYMDEMADLMRQFNNLYSFDNRQREDLQNLDGYSPTIFYDFGDYVYSLLKQNDAPLEYEKEFGRLMDKLVPYKTNTDYFFTATRGPIKINTFSGITVSDPSENRRAMDKKNTKWYFGTH